MNGLMDWQAVMGSAEFWMSVAFILVVFLAVRPLGRFLTRWGNDRAAKISDDIRKADELHEKARLLLEKYQLHTANKETERQDILKSGEKDISFLKQQAADQLQERIQNKAEAVQFRLNIIRENSSRDLKDQMTDTLLNKTRLLISESHRIDDTDHALEAICKALDIHRREIR